MTNLENISELEENEETEKLPKTKPTDISESLKAVGADAYLMHGALHDSDIYYATRFLASDPFSYLLTAAGDETLLISDMEKGRAEIESRVENEKIKTTTDYKYREIAKEKKDADLAYVLVLKEMMAEKNVKTVAVSYDFSAYYFDMLQKEGVRVVLIKSPFVKSRAVKTPIEIEKIAESQKAAEKAMAAAIKMISFSFPDATGSGKLVYDGQVLTGKMVLSEIARVLMENDCADEETIVSCGPDSADPHGKTYGALYANHPIVIDIFPQHKYNRYFGDMTRTVIRGEVSEKLILMYDAVKGAQEIGVKTAKPGVTCAEVHNAVCDYLENAGFDTYRSGSKVGFIHTTGHGVGLDIHEMPSVSDNPHVLEEGNVITIEPGLYYPGVGGIRIEDTIVITKDGCRNLNTMPKIFEIDEMMKMI
ncbi:Methionine aminopeptidase 1, mitochondrial [Methanimicrococcus hongohii]|uniref:Methionine aminopeptidase 1, mitochondrial n=1 Tax=Methanimicrococcus hongohii TaxID=3028295 RepID=A0AA96V0U4_9EURY|nr:Xaa-Pro peptidase family protein [Methanimicrococcus sp. Hf6]WNY24312.1 Methionine aminopeptidase 1, mitochondrial [Methanimicrococcus sp. Hf6]